MAGIMAVFARQFPRLQATGRYEITSPKDQRYNCIAYAAGDMTRWWWPSPLGLAPSNYWPDGVPREPTVFAFALAFGSLGYSACADGMLEPGYEKVALYAQMGEVKHAARQLGDGTWVSKLGRNVDIVHFDANGVEGPTYGAIAGFFRRPHLIMLEAARIA